MAGALESLAVDQALPGPALPRIPGKIVDPAAARRVAQDFEAVFLAEMLRPMFDAIEAEPPFGGGSAEKMWKSLAIDEYGKAVARSGGVGIADAVMAQILQTQQVK